MCGALAVITKLMLGLIVVLVVADVAMRNLAKPIAWSASLTEYLLIYIAFLAAPALVRAKGHVCADFMRMAMPPPVAAHRREMRLRAVHRPLSASRLDRAAGPAR